MNELQDMIIACCAVFMILANFQGSFLYFN